MGKIRSFLGFLTVLFTLMGVGVSHAETGYSCPTSRQYISCAAANMRLTNKSAGNKCVACPENSHSDAGNTEDYCTCNDGYSVGLGASTQTNGANCTANVYNITYELDGGIQAATDVPTTYTYGTGATINGTPTRYGYEFDGWCTDAELNTNCTKNPIINTTETGDKKFYAKWYQLYCPNGKYGDGVVCNACPADRSVSLRGRNEHESNCLPAPLTITTTYMDAGTVFEFEFATSLQQFLVNWGDGTTDLIPGSTGAYAASHAYATDGEHTIRVGVVDPITAYPGPRAPVISFAHNIYLAGIDGLGALFPTISNPSTPQPNFYQSFEGCINLTTLGEHLFDGISGTPFPEMFFRTFAGTGLTTLPDNLFSGISGSMMYNASHSYNAFQNTFEANPQLTGYVPRSMFGDIEYLGITSIAGFENMFQGADNMRTTCPAGTYMLVAPDSWGSAAFCDVCPAGTTTFDNNESAECFVAATITLNKSGINATIDEVDSDLYNMTTHGGTANETFQCVPDTTVTLPTLTPSSPEYMFAGWINNDTPLSDVETALATENDEAMAQLLVNDTECDSDQTYNAVFVHQINLNNWTAGAESPNSAGLFGFVSNGTLTSAYCLAGSYFTLPTTSNLSDPLQILKWYKGDDVVTGNILCEAAIDYNAVIECVPLPENATRTEGSCEWTCNAGYYQDGDACGQCPSGYPNSEAGATAITQCYSNSRPRYASQPPCIAPEHATNALCTPCTVAPCFYSMYSDETGTADGEFHDGCTENTGTCSSNLLSFTCDAGYYKDGNACTQCPTARPLSPAGSIDQSACHPADFVIDTTPMDVGDIFSFELNAHTDGKVLVDWGDGTIDFETEHKYSTASVNGWQISFTSYKINGYPKDTAVISFEGNNYIKGLSGRLGDLFPAVGTAIGEYPKFIKTFARCPNLETVENDLFYGVYGGEGVFNSTFAESGNDNFKIGEKLFPTIKTVGREMFADTFAYSKLKTIPNGMFNGLKELRDNGSKTAAPALFDGTFKGTLISSIPSDLFLYVVTEDGDLADILFHKTFADCKQLTDIPNGLFDSINVASNLTFEQTFAYDTALQTIPEALFAGIVDVKENNSFEATFAGDISLTGFVPHSMFEHVPNFGKQNLDGFTKTFVDTPLMDKFCPQNWFVLTPPSDTWETVVCKRCKAGTHTTAENYMTQCIPDFCPENYYLNGYTCTQCDTGYTTPANNTATSCTPIQTTITLRMDGVAEPLGTVTATYGQPWPQLSADKMPKQAGQIFDGYYMGGTKVYNADGTTVVTGNYTGTADIEIWAKMIACHNGYYCDSSTPTAITKCPTDKHLSFRGAKSESDCFPAAFSATFEKPDGNVSVIMEGAYGDYVVDFWTEGGGGENDFTEIHHRADVPEGTDGNNFAASYTYPSNKTVTVSIGGKTRLYKTHNSSPMGLPALKFSKPEKIIAVNGSLGALFPTLDLTSLPLGQAYSPAFTGTFANTTNLTEIPADLFKGITSFGNAYFVFGQTFENSGITYIPDGLFSKISGAGYGAFSGTFKNCVNLRGTIPANLFENVSGYPHAFNGTFAGCENLQGPIPADLFKNVSYNGDLPAFIGTFKNCTSLTGELPDGLFANRNRVSNITGLAQEFEAMFENTGLTGIVKRSVFGDIDGLGTQTFTGNFARMFAGANNMDSECPAGWYALVKPTDWGQAAFCAPCPDAYPNSEAGATSITQCYSDTKLRPSTGSQICPWIDGAINVNCDGNTCELPTCEYVAYSNETGDGDGIVKSGCETNEESCNKDIVMFSCAAGFYTDYANKTCPACPETHPKSYVRSGSMYQCYAECVPEHAVEFGTAIPVAPVATYPNMCQYTGVSNTGNPCDIEIDENNNEVCVEKSCKFDYEMINGKCMPCNREFAAEYSETGNCVIKSCTGDYHPNGKQCEYNFKDCNIANAESARHVWDEKLQAYSICLVTECAAGYHISSNICVPDEQACTTENGSGVQHWNHTTKSWDECLATRCAPGYTNVGDKCERCDNYYGVNGEPAVSSYVRECEIASCLYQGEIYNLEHNECVPICEGEYTDETGTRYRNGNKCIRECNAGYKPW